MNNKLTKQNHKHGNTEQNESERKGGGRKVERRGSD